MMLNNKTTMKSCCMNVFIIEVKKKDMKTRKQDGDYIYVNRNKSIEFYYITLLFLSKKMLVTPLHDEKKNIYSILKIPIAYICETPLFAEINTSN